MVLLSKTTVITVIDILFLRETNIISQLSDICLCTDAFNLSAKHAYCMMTDLCAVSEFCDVFIMIQMFVTR